MNLIVLLTTERLRSLLSRAVVLWLPNQLAASCDNNRVIWRHYTDALSRCSALWYHWYGMAGDLQGGDTQAAEYNIIIMFSCVIQWLQRPPLPATSVSGVSLDWSSLWLSLDCCEEETEDAADSFASDSSLGCSIAEQNIFVIQYLTATASMMY